MQSLEIIHRFRLFLRMAYHRACYPLVCCHMDPLGSTESSYMIGVYTKPSLNLFPLFFPPLFSFSKQADRIFMLRSSAHAFCTMFTLRSFMFFLSWTWARELQNACMVFSFLSFPPFLAVRYYCLRADCYENMNRDRNALT